MMKTSPAGIALICHFEGCKLEAYPDPGLGWKLPTIGYGHTGAGVTQGLRIDQARADQWLAGDLIAFECAVSGVVYVPLIQCRFDALVSFAYNCKGWRTSTLIRLCTAGNFAAAANEFPRWCHDGNGIETGLVLRRAAEQTLFNGGTPILV
jgi:lysozyme